jgi:hypothetical protein
MYKFYIFNRLILLKNEIVFLFNKLLLLLVVFFIKKIIIKAIATILLKLFTNKP